MGAGNVKAALKSYDSSKQYQYQSPPQHYKSVSHNTNTPTSAPNPAPNPNTTTSPSNNVSMISTSIRHAANTSSKKVWLVESNEHRTLICRFCGGASCKREDW